MAPAVVVVQVE